MVGSLARQRSRAERRAEQTQQQMAAIVECSEDAIFSTNSDGMITSWNRGAETLYQYSADEAVGTTCDAYRTAGPSRRSGEQSRPTESRGIRAPAIRPSACARMAARVERDDFDFSAAPRPSGQIIGASAIARDISAQKRSEEALRRNEKLATAGRLAASIAHEINNPLEAVTNLIYLARHDPAAMRRSHLEMAQREVARVAHIAQQTWVSCGNLPQRPRSMSVPAGRSVATVCQQTTEETHSGREAFSRRNDPRLRRRIAAAFLEPDRKCGRCDGTGRVLVATG